MIQLIQTSTNKHFVYMLIIHEKQKNYKNLRHHTTHYVSFYDVGRNTKDVVGVSYNVTGSFAGISPSLIKRLYSHV